MQPIPQSRTRVLGALLMLTALLALVASRQDSNIQAAPPKSVDRQSISKPNEDVMKKAGTFTGDLRSLPYITAEKQKQERPERGLSHANPLFGGQGAPIGSGLAPNVTLAAMPTPSASFDGLDYATWGGGHPPDPTGDVGPTYFIQAVNTSVGIYNKSTGTRVAAFTFNTFMSQGNFGNLCDTNNFGDPVILYDSFEDHWVITDFAFTLDGSGNVINPPGNFECFAVSQTGDPVSGGWNYYSINTTGGVGDYPKLGIWPDGIYMSVNIFGYPSGASFQNSREYAFNKFQMYAGLSNVQVVSFDAPASEFTMLPANARLQAGAPPIGAPNYFAVVWQYVNVVSIYKFHVDWNRISTSTFTGPFYSLAPANWASAPSNVPTSGGTNIDTLAPRLMIQNQYTNIGGVESVWDTHTVQGSSSTQAAVRWYQVSVTGGTVGASTTQASTWNPDTNNRFMSSLAVDRAGNMALGYSVASSSLMPAIRYAGRLASDPASTLGQTETTLINGTGTQNTASYTRWGDYSTMTLDPNGCTFWYTQEYYQVTGTNDNTRIGAFSFAPTNCTPVGAGGTVLGTVTGQTGGAPMSGATVTFGSRTTTTNGSGQYSFTGIPAGTYPSISVSAVAYNSASASLITVTDGGTNTQNFALTNAATSGCPVDTAQLDFQLGVPINTDLTTSPGDVILTAPPSLDQQNTSVTTNGFGFDSANWFGQTFTAGATGKLVKADIDLFCSGCTGTTPNITVSLRATSSNLPTGADLATGTITGFSSGAGGYFTATFSPQVSLTSGTVYALVLRPVSNPSAGTYAYVVSSGSTYANGRRVTSANSGTSWSGQTDDVGFKTYIAPGYSTSGTLLSGLKDANPASNAVATWSTLSWTATTPASTSVQFQVAASNNVNGPFNLVGPDGTAGTFFTTSGASLSQFNGFRYLKYQAYLGTSNTANTPTLSDVTICYTNVAVTPTVTSTQTATLTPVPNTATATATLYARSVTTGWYYTCAWRSNGGTQCWGQNNFNQALPPEGDFLTVRAGAFHTCGLRLNNTLVCWGRNTEGQTTPPAGNFIGLSSGGYHSCAIRIDSSVACWGRNDEGQSTPPIGSFTAVSAGGYHTCGIHTDGTLACWGDNTYGQVDAPPGSFSAVSAGFKHTCGVRSAGTVVCWGLNSSGQTNPPSGSFLSVAAGGQHSCGMQMGGIAACWGRNDYDQSSPPSGSFATVSAGYEHSCGVRTDYTIVCWGRNNQGQGYLELLPTDLPLGQVGTPYQQALNAVGGNTPYQYSLAGGSLPAGVSLSTDGVLSGALTTIGNARFLVQAVDGTGIGRAQGYTLGIPATSTLGFSDVPPDAYFYEPVRYLVYWGIGGGYSDNTFRPYNNTTRGQLSKLVTLGFRLAITTPAGGGYTFSDVLPGSTFFGYVETVSDQGVVSGYACGGVGEPCDGAHRPYYRPGANVTRGQLSKIVAGAAGWPPLVPSTASFSDVPLGSTFSGYIEAAVCRGVVGGYSDGTFRPGNPATRGQIAKIVYNALLTTRPCLITTRLPK